MNTASVLARNAVRFVCIAILSVWTAVEVVHILRLIPKVVRFFTDMAANPAAATALFLIIGGVMLIFALAIAAVGYYIARRLWSNRLR